MHSVERELFFSNFSDVRDSTQVCTHTTTFPALANAFVQLGHDTRANKDGPAINFSDYAGRGRLRQNILAVCAVTLDIDAISIDGLRTLREQLKNFRSICYSTFSHHPEKPRVRVIVPMGHSVGAGEYREYAIRLSSILAVECDKISLDPNQIYYLPSRPAPEASGHFVDCNVNVDFLKFEDASTGSETGQTGKGIEQQRIDRAVDSLPHSQRRACKHSFYIEV